MARKPKSDPDPRPKVLQGEDPLARIAEESRALAFLTSYHPANHLVAQVFCILPDRPTKIVHADVLAVEARVGWDRKTGETTSSYSFTVQIKGRHHPSVWISKLGEPPQVPVFEREGICVYPKRDWAEWAVREYERRDASPEDYKLAGAR
jgi:hypothetical protein